MIKTASRIVFDNVMIGLDGRPSNRDAVALAQQLVCVGAPLILAHVRGGSELLPGGKLSPATGGGMTMEALGLGWPPTELIEVPGLAVGRTLNELATSRHIDLLILGSCRRAAAGQVLAGNDAMAALSSAPCAVAIAPAGYAEQTPKLTVLGAITRSSYPTPVTLDTARQLASRLGSGIRALSLLPAPELSGEDQIELGLVDSQQSSFDPTSVAYEHYGNELAGLCEQVDMLIIERGSYSPLGRLLFVSAADIFKAEVRCPLIVLPPHALISGGEIGLDEPTADGVVE